MSIVQTEYNVISILRWDTHNTNTLYTFSKIVIVEISTLEFSTSYLYIQAFISHVFIFNCEAKVRWQIENESVSR